MPTINQAREWYQTVDIVHDFDHVLRVFHLAEQLAMAEGADREIVRTAVLLHDTSPSVLRDEGKRLEHHIISAEFASQVLREEGWPNERIKAVQHCIRAHRYRSTELPETIEAMVVFDADKLDAIGAIGVVRVIAYAALQGNPFFAEPSSQFKNKYILEPGETYTSYHEFLYKLCHIKERLYTKTAKKRAEMRHQFILNFFEELILEYQGKR